MTRDELELLTIAELAALWRVSTRTIQRRIATGEIPTVPFGGHRRIRAVDAARIADSGMSGYARSTSTERTPGDR